MQDLTLWPLQASLGVCILQDQNASKKDTGAIQYVLISYVSYTISVVYMGRSQSPKCTAQGTLLNAPW